MSTARRHVAAFTLVEILIVISVLGVVAGLLIPHFEPNIPHRLQATAEVVAADLALVRSLAVANNSTYQITFDPPGNRYYFEHTGPLAALDDLPASPFAGYAGPSDRHTAALDDLPLLGQPARLANVYKMVSSGSPQQTATLEFDGLGQTTRSEPTAVWLMAGQGAARRFQSVTVDPVTGLTSIGKVLAALPPGAALLAPLDQGGGS